jgi:hypothetical protein
MQVAFSLSHSSTFTCTTPVKPYKFLSFPGVVQVKFFWVHSQWSVSEHSLLLMTEASSVKPFHKTRLFVTSAENDIMGINVAHHKAYCHHFQLFIPARTNGMHLFAIMQILIEIFWKIRNFVNFTEMFTFIAKNIAKKILQNPIRNEQYIHIQKKYTVVKCFFSFSFLIGFSDNLICNKRKHFCKIHNIRTSNIFSYLALPGEDLNHRPIDRWNSNKSSQLLRSDTI